MEQEQAQDFELLTLGDSEPATIERALKFYVNDTANYHVEDVGIGFYEYGGAQGYHTDVAFDWEGPDKFEIIAPGMPDDWERDMPNLYLKTPHGLTYEAVPEVSGNRNLYTLKYQYAS